MEIRTDISEYRKYSVDDFKEVISMLMNCEYIKLPLISNEVHTKATTIFKSCLAYHFRSKANTLVTPDFKLLYKSSEKIQESSPLESKEILIDTLCNFMLKYCDDLSFTKDPMKLLLEKNNYTSTGDHTVPTKPTTNNYFEEETKEIISDYPYPINVIKYLLSVLSDYCQDITLNLEKIFNKSDAPPKQGTDHTLYIDKLSSFCKEWNHYSSICLSISNYFKSAEDLFNSALLKFSNRADRFVLWIELDKIFLMKCFVRIESQLETTFLEVMSIIMKRIIETFAIGKLNINDLLKKNKLQKLIAPILSSYYSLILVDTREAIIDMILNGISIYEMTESYLNIYNNRIFKYIGEQLTNEIWSEAKEFALEMFKKTKPMFNDKAFVLNVSLIYAKCIQFWIKNSYITISIILKQYNYISSLLGVCKNNAVYNTDMSIDHYLTNNCEQDEKFKIENKTFYEYLKSWEKVALKLYKRAKKNVDNENHQVNKYIEYISQ